MPEIIDISVHVTKNHDTGHYTWTYEPPPNSSNVIATLAPGLDEIRFGLQGDTGVTWATDWIQWTDLEGSPPGITPQRLDDSSAVLVVDNDVTAVVQYGFKLKVNSADGPEMVISPDPDIILDPP